MPILGSSDSAANKDVKNMDKWEYNYLIELKTKTIPCRSKCRLKHYIGLVIKILVIQLQFKYLRALQCKHRSMAMDDL